MRVGISHFQTFGYHGAGLVAILEEAAAPKGSFYHHYPNGKEQLAAEAVRWLANEVGEFLQSLDLSGATGSTMILAMADYAARGLQEAPAARGSLITVLAAEVAPVAPEVRDAVRNAIGGWTKILAIGAAREGFPDPTTWGRIALAQLEGATTLARIAADPGIVISLVSSWLELSDRTRPHGMTPHDSMPVYEGMRSR